MQPEPSGPLVPYVSSLNEIPHFSDWTIQDRPPGADVDVVVASGAEGQRREPVALGPAPGPAVQGDHL